MSTRYVTVYIVNSSETPFLRRKLSSEYKAVECLKSNKQQCAHQFPVLTFVPEYKGSILT